MLQETHWVSTLEKRIKVEWGSECVINGNSTNSNGVAILFNKALDFTIHNTTKDPNGRYILLDITFSNKRITLANVYGPSGNDSPNFYENFFLETENIGNENIIIAGDWNVALNDKLDTFRYRGVSRPNAKRKILDKMLLLNLIDVWREFNPFKRQYTWRKFNSTKQGRIDFFSHYKIPCTLY